MKIIGCCEELCEMRLKLQSTDRRLHWQIQGAFYPVSDEIGKDRCGSAYIEFNDSREIDQLIMMLQRFKDDNERCMGIWI